jgi:hypothetical protein
VDQHIRLAVRAHIEVFDIAETRTTALASVIWFLTVFFASMTLLQANKEKRKQGNSITDS